VQGASPIETAKQTRTWRGRFGREYTDRNPQSVAELDALYSRWFGRSRTSLNQEFLGDLNRSMRVLEVGANVGCQLQALKTMGFENLYGIELQRYAVEQARGRLNGIDIIQASAFDIPFKDGYFDLVFTSGVLIHISPEQIEKALSEIVRCTRCYVWGFEYYAESYKAVRYRGLDDLLWKTDFAELYRSSFPALKVVRKRRLQHDHNDNEDCMFLLQKPGN
jgi:pseudaminic acid biosynthesis-associated methylase